MEEHWCTSSSSPLMSEPELRCALHNLIDVMDLTSLSAELPPLETLYSTAQLSMEQIRRCMHSIADTMDFESELWACQTLLDEDSAEYNADRLSEMCIAALQSRVMVEIECAVDRTSLFTVEYMRSERSRKYVLMNYVDHDVLTMMDELLLRSASHVTEIGIARREKERAEFLGKAALQRPRALRVIDIKASCLNKEVMLVEYNEGVQQEGYCAISHTYGMYVYEVFNCQCTARFSGLTINPRCRVGPCSHDAAVSLEDKHKHDRTINDILHMCEVLRAAGVQYAWHDGVCIAQHDEAEVEATIKCIGWVYSYAMETIIYLHYVGKPMAPIRHGNDMDNLTCRWHTRVWTLQEAALSKCRRYCVRVGCGPFEECRTVEEFEKKVACWYSHDTSKIEVIEEKTFFELLIEAIKMLHPLYCDFTRSLWMEYEGMDESNWMLYDARISMWFKASEWRSCLYSLLDTLIFTCFKFPTAQEAVERGSARDSKHIGDHINSILAISGVNNFVAPKDINMEASTLEFFKRQGQQGLEYAVFAINEIIPIDLGTKCFDEVLQRRWLPYLWKPLHAVRFGVGESYLGYEVLEDGNVEVRGELLCLKVEFTVKQVDEDFPNGDILEYSKTECCSLIADIGLSVLAIDLILFGSSNFRAVSPQDPQCTMGIAICPFLAMENGNYREHFSGHLVLPLRYKSSDTSDRHWPIVVVEGDLHTLVHKVGCFKPSVFFSSCIRKVIDHPDTTVLNKLIIGQSSKTCLDFQYLK